jgi:hypothetical protein
MACGQGVPNAGLQVLILLNREQDGRRPDNARGRGVVAEERGGVAVAGGSPEGCRQMRTVITLDAEASRQAIEAAIRTHAPVILESASFPEATVNGFLTSGDEKVLLVEVTGRPSVSFDLMVDAHCSARLYGERRYQFASTIFDVPHEGRSSSLVLARPRVIGLVERRRFPRASLAPSSEVTLGWPPKGSRHRHAAALLNISPDGLACRVEESVSSTVEQGDRIRTSFQLPNVEHTFCLDASIMNKTPASQGWTILGLQFVQAPAAADQLLRLRDAIEDPAAFKAAMEAYA